MKWRNLLGISWLAWTVWATAGPAPDSLYQLPAMLTTQRGEAAGFDLYRGHPVLVSMFYGSCRAACPLLITAIQTYEQQLDTPGRERLRVLLISFDAARDTPAQLQKLADRHRADARRWTFSSAPAADARKIAALLDIQYRRLDDGGYTHSQRITLLNSEGRVLAATADLYGDKTFTATLRRATAGAAQASAPPLPPISSEGALP